MINTIPLVHEFDQQEDKYARHYGLPFIVLRDHGEMMCGYFRTDRISSHHAQLMPYSEYIRQSPVSGLDSLGGSSHQRRYATVYRNLYEEFNKMSVERGLVEDPRAEKIFSGVAVEISNLASKLEDLKKHVSDALEQRSVHKESHTKKAYDVFFTEAAAQVKPQCIRVVPCSSTAECPQQSEDELVPRAVQNFFGPSTASAIVKVPAFHRIPAEKRRRTLLKMNDEERLKHYQNSYSIINGTVQQVQAQSFFAAEPACTLHDFSISPCTPHDLPLPPCAPHDLHLPPMAPTLNLDFMDSIPHFSMEDMIGSGGEVCDASGQWT